MYIQTLGGPTKLNQQIRFPSIMDPYTKGFQLLHIWPMQEGYQRIPTNLQSREDLYQIKGSHFYSWTWHQQKHRKMQMLAKKTTKTEINATFHRILGMTILLSYFGCRTCHRGSDQRPPLLVVAWSQVIFDGAIAVSVLLCYTSDWYT